MEPKGPSLQAQMAKLQRNIRNRDKRRQEDRERKVSEASERGDVDPYDSKVARRRTNVATGGVQLGGAALDASQEPARIFRCELCKVTFTSDVSLQQHLLGPVHAKAVTAQQAQRDKSERLNRTRGLAEAALAAAQWQVGDADHVARGGQASTSAAASGAAASSSNGTAARSPLPAAPRPSLLSRSQPPPSSSTQPVLSHADMVAAAQRSVQQDDMPSINGWAPPLIQLPPLNPPAARLRPRAAQPAAREPAGEPSNQQGPVSEDGRDGSAVEDEEEEDGNADDGRGALFPLVDYADDSQSEESGSESEHSNNSNLNAGPVDGGEVAGGGQYDDDAVFNNGMQAQNFNEGQSDSESQESEDNDSSDSDAVGVAVESFF